MSQPPFGATLDVLGLSIPFYSLLMMTAVGIGIVLAMREERRLRLPKDTILNFALWAIPLGVVGARLYYVAFNWGAFSRNPLDILRVWNGGLAIYGAVIGGLLAALIATRGEKARLITLLDVCAPSLVLGQAIGRWGNYANMEAYGERLYESGLQFFPLAVEIPVVGANGTAFWYWHMATFFYESLFCAAVFVMLMAIRKRTRRSGDVACWYVLLYGAARTVIEGLRTDSLMINVSAAQVRISQILSALACIAMVAIFFARMPRKRRAPPADALAWAMAAVGIGCTFVGEFERNAYPGLFPLAQGLLGALLVLDILGILVYARHTRRFAAPGRALVVSGVLCALMLALGLLAERGVFYVPLRQTLAMLHVVWAGAWFYLRGQVRKRRRAQAVEPTAMPTESPEEAEHV
ncbi:MAG: prolipoprotein diacylglyceryl transferase [Oscillospiraceae bacterium]|jgi:phosphatidylglycerol:prolipoprotein diacylglycerol transferase|nr:prolipoprotein diacylglyceryl transferase [Oscillospiraceae bacterium]